MSRENIDEEKEDQDINHNLEDEGRNQPLYNLTNENEELKNDGNYQNNQIENTSPIQLKNGKRTPDCSSDEDNKANFKRTALMTKYEQYKSRN